MANPIIINRHSSTAPLSLMPGEFYVTESGDNYGIYTVINGKLVRYTPTLVSVQSTSDEAYRVPLETVEKNDPGLAGTSYVYYVKNENTDKAITVTYATEGEEKNISVPAESVCEIRAHRTGSGSTDMIVSANIIGVDTLQLLEESLPFIVNEVPVHNGSGTCFAISVKKSRSVATGAFSTAWGCQTTASGSVSHSEGYDTIASGDYSHAEGTNTVASEESSHAEGNETTASGKYSHSEGYKTIASGDENGGAHAEGNETVASGDFSHAEGYSTTASGNGSHAEGVLTVVHEDASGGHAEGNSTEVLGEFGHAEGIQTTASGLYSHAEGESTLASGNISHAEGMQTTASGLYSHAEGYKTNASGNYSHVDGNGTEGNNLSEHGSGQWNVSRGNNGTLDSTFGIEANTLFTVGNGKDNDNRHNAFEIRQDGTILISKKDKNYYNSEMINLQETLNKLTTGEIDDETWAKKEYVDGKDNELIELIAKLHATITCSVSPSMIFKNEPTNVNINTGITFDGKSLTHTATVDGSPLSNPYNINQATNKTFNVVLNVDNADPAIKMTINRTLNVSTYWPRYYGRLDKDTITASEVLGLDKQSVASSAAMSNKAFTDSNPSYIWLCVPTGMSISKVTMGGFEFPMAAPQTVSVNCAGNVAVNYLCYRSFNRMDSGTSTLTIS